MFFLRQCLAVLLSITWVFVFALGVLRLIDRVARVRVDEGGYQEMGLDTALLGEEAHLGSI